MELVRINMKIILIALIKFYRKFISPMKGTKCPYIPSCSEYGLQAIEKYGAFKGTILALYRIIRCNPLSKGGLDFPPKKFDFKKLFSQNSVDEFNDFDNKP